MIICKKIFFFEMFEFFFKGGTLWCRNDQKKILRFFKFSKIFFEKWPQWDITNVERNKVMKFELHRTVHWGVTRDIPPGGVRWTPPCRIGLRNLEAEGYLILFAPAWQNGLKKRKDSTWHWHWDWTCQISTRSAELAAIRA